MDHYVDIRLRPDPDFPPPMLMGALYGKLHRALHDLDADDIGVSFPDHRTGVRARSPGDRLRLHGEKTRLEALFAQPWLKGLRELVACSDIAPVPPGAHHCTVQRRQFNTGSPSRARRYAKRHDIPEAQVREIYAKVAEKQVTLPFIQLASQSTRQRFCLFIEHGKPQSQPSKGRFNHYGLSREATIPWF